MYVVWDAIRAVAWGEARLLSFVSPELCTFELSPASIYGLLHISQLDIRCMPLLSSLLDLFCLFALSV